jgi:uncharacterized membrane protein
MRVRRDIDLGVTSTLAVCALIASRLLPDGALPRVVLTGLLVFIGPGYAIGAAALHRSLPSLTERLVLGLGLSLAVAACGGLVLNVTPWGLTATTWTVFLAGLTLCASLVAAFARATHRTQGEAAFAWGHLALRPLDFGLLVVAALIGAAALRFSSSPPQQQLNQAYVMLWAVPDRQTASTVHLGVQNMESTPEDYVLRVEQYDQTLQEYAIQLEPTQTWEADLQLPTGTIEPGGDLQAVLFRADSPFTPFRQTIIRAAS